MTAIEVERHGVLGRPGNPAQSGRKSGRFWQTGAIAAVLWLGSAAVIEFWPEIIPAPYGRELAILSVLVAALLVLVLTTGSLLGKTAVWIRYYGPWFAVAAVGLGSGRC